MLILKNRDYPEILILEMGVDKPFDMDYLNSIVSCDIAVLTGIGEAHLENFSSREKLASEKAKIFFGLKKNGWAILNFDNEKAVKISDSLKNKIISYGFSENANVRASNLVFKFSDGGVKDGNLSAKF
jgi:UDP-N-acetylmuramoyl-tripeptide--D-alanyl-D-alanine ligase